MTITTMTAKKATTAEGHGAAAAIMEEFEPSDIDESDDDDSDDNNDNNDGGFGMRGGGITGG